MPFPPNTFDTVKDALLFQPRDFLAEPTMNIVNDEDDSYWDAYGADDSDNPALLTVTKYKSQVGTEDAYWAQYAEVHGQYSTCSFLSLCNSRSRFWGLYSPVPTPSETKA